MDRSAAQHEQKFETEVLGDAFFYEHAKPLKLVALDW
jgi:hypothetical protein